MSHTPETAPPLPSLSVATPGDAPVPRRQAPIPQRHRLLPDGRLLRDVLRGCAGRVARARAHADVAVEGRRPAPPSRCAASPITPPTATSPRLVRKGYRVAICEQVEDPRKAKGIVKREVVRVVSPGTLTDAALPRRARAVPSCWPSRPRRRGDAARGPRRGAARSVHRRVHTRRVHGADGSQALSDEIAVLRPREIVVPAGRRRRARIAAGHRRDAAAGHRARRLALRARERAPARCSINCACRGLEGFGLDAHEPRCARRARSCATCATRRRPISRTCARIAFQAGGRCPADRSDDARAPRGGGIGRAAAAGSLLDEIDRTVTPMGGRLLRAWLLRPLVALEPIRDRLDAVEELAFRTTERGKLREALKAVQDLERLVSRVALSTAGPRDLRRPAASRSPPCRACACCSASVEAPLVRASSAELDDLADLRDADRAHDRGRAAGAGARRRLRPRRRRCGARRAAADLPLGQAGDRGAGRARARADGDHLAQGPLQSRVRLLHRDLQVEPARRARRLPCASRPSPAASASSRRR